MICQFPHYLKDNLTHSVPEKSQRVSSFLFFLAQHRKGYFYYYNLSLPFSEHLPFLLQINTELNSFQPWKNKYNFTSDPWMSLVNIMSPWRATLIQCAKYKCEVYGKSICRVFIESQNHRVAQVGRDLKDHESPTPCHRQGHQPPHLPGFPEPHPAWPWTPPWMDGVPTTSLDSMFQHLTTLTVKDFPLTSNLNLPSLNLKPFPLVLLLSTPLESWLPSCLQAPFRYWKAAIRSSRMCHNI